MIFVLRKIAALCAVAAFSLAAPAQSARWLDVPFVAQTENGCGAAVISMVMQYWNKNGTAVPELTFDATRIQAQLYSPSDRGIKTSAMMQYFQDHGFRSFAIQGTIQDLADQVGKGRPLIVALAPRAAGEPPHYVVVAGVNASQNVVLVNDPAQRKLLKIDQGEFDKAWARTERWTLLVVPNVPNA